MTRWGFDRKAGAKRRPYPLVRALHKAAKPRIKSGVTEEIKVVLAAPVRPAKIPAASIPSSMESQAAAWAGRQA